MLQLRQCCSVRGSPATCPSAPHHARGQLEANTPADVTPSGTSKTSTGKAVADKNHPKVQITKVYTAGNYFAKWYKSQCPVAYLDKFEAGFRALTPDQMAAVYVTFCSNQATRTRDEVAKETSTAGPLTVALGGWAAARVIR